MKSMRFNYLLLSLLVLLCSACAYHAWKPLPPELHTLYINTENPYSPFMTQLINRLRAMDVTIVPKPEWAKYQLDISPVTLTSTNGAIVSTTTATQFVITQSVTVQVLSYHHKVVSNARHFAVSQNMLLNTSQIAHTNTRAPVLRMLSAELVSQIYHWLSSDALRNTLRQYETTHNTAPTKHHGKD